ncbi:MAG: helix-turn-helix transcriptional regulator, partial [Raoultibacter sp.]
MSFADNLAYIRQYYGVTQETLAEQLGVSRQTISKWEAGINFPETDKLLMLCDLYNTNLDDLLRGSVEIANEQDTDLYDAHMNRFSKAIAAIPLLVLLGVSILITLDTIGFAANLSAVIMFTFIVVASILGVVAGLNHTEFKRKHSEIDPHYSDATLDEFGRKFTIMISVGVGMILVDIIALVGLSPEQGDIINLGFGPFSFDLIMGPFLAIIGIAASLLTYAGLQKEKYDRSEITYITK